MFVGYTTVCLPIKSLVLKISIYLLLSEVLFIRFSFLDLHTWNKYMIAVNAMRIYGVNVGQAPVKKINYRRYSETIIKNIIIIEEI